MESEKAKLNAELAKKEAEQDSLTMEIGQLYVKYQNTKSETLKDILYEKVEEINKIEDDLHQINAKLGLQ